MAVEIDHPATTRIDKLIWYLRFAKSRSLAQAIVEKGRIRLNGQRINKPGHVVRAGDVLTLMIQGEVQAIRILTLPTRRGPASEAAACWEPATKEEPTDHE